MVFEMRDKLAFHPTTNCKLTILLLHKSCIATVTVPVQYYSHYKTVTVSTDVK